MLNLANKITIMRIAAAPLIVALLYFPNRWTTFLACMIFGIASISDLVDGMIARRSGMVTNLGKFLDPLADKLLISGVLIILVQLGWVQAWIALIIISRELTVTGLRAIAVEQGMVLAADKYGKLKTVLQCCALGPLIFHYDLFGLPIAQLGNIILYMALIMTVFSGVNYLWGFYKDMQEQGPAHDEASQTGKTE